MKKVAIIGAGLSGLSAARKLQKEGCEVTVLEKSRSLGGRCASRLWLGHVVDHGAQYFTMRHPAFAAEMKALCGDLILPITTPILKEDGNVLTEKSARFYHLKGNNHLGRTLADGLDIRKDVTVESIEAMGDQWLVAGKRYDAVLVTAPGPQMAKLVGDEGSFSTFAPCLTALFAYSMPWSDVAREVYAHSCPLDDLAWSACENHKLNRIQEGSVVFVAQAGLEFSQRYLEAEPTEWAALLRSSLELRWKLDPAKFATQFLHRWRYARVIDPVEKPILPRGLFVAGDTFSESRVESAWQAGLEAAEKMQ